MRALVVMDMQNATVGDDHADIFSYDPQLIDHVNERISKWNHENVYYIRNIMKNNLLNHLAPVHVYEGSHAAQLADRLNIVSENIYCKYKADAFSNEKFATSLRNKQFDEIELIGVDGGGCVAYTALGAAKAGYKVFLDEKLIGTVLVKQEGKLRKKIDAAGVIRLS